MGQQPAGKPVLLRAQGRRRLWKGGGSGLRREGVAGVSPPLSPPGPGEQELHPGLRLDFESWLCFVFAVWFIAGHFTSLSQFPYLENGRLLELNGTRYIKHVLVLSE